MTIRVLGYPLRFLRLTDVKGRRLYYHDLPAILVVSCLLSFPYIIFQETNYFGNDGFLDRVGSFSSTLTGFYVAGLLAVAAFGREVSGLDKIIEVGPVLLPSREKDEPPDRLTRREYVCLMFGYLAFLSLALTLMAIVGLTATTSVPTIPSFTVGYDQWNIIVEKAWIRSVAIMFYGLIISSLSVTTLHGLYYLIDRLYAKSPEIVKKRHNPPEEEA